MRCPGTTGGSGRCRRFAYVEVLHASVFQHPPPLDVSVPLVILAYASRITKRLPDTAIAALGTQAAARNARDGVTGLLLCGEAMFVQVLEGPREAVLATIRRIRRDERHHGIVLLRLAHIDARRYGGWSMGVVQGDRFAGFPGLDALLLPEFTPEAALADVDGTLGVMRTLPVLLGGSSGEPVGA